MKLLISEFFKINNFIILNIFREKSWLKILFSEFNEIFKEN